MMQRHYSAFRYNNWQQDMSGEEQPMNLMVQQTVVVNSSLIGRVEEFVMGSDWKHYVKQMEMFFKVNNVLEAKKVPIILTLIGNKMYALVSYSTH